MVFSFWQAEACSVLLCSSMLDLPEVGTHQHSSKPSFQEVASSRSREGAFWGTWGEGQGFTRIL